jgi:hypothetical protein
VPVPAETFSSVEAVEAVDGSGKPVTSWMVVDGQLAVLSGTTSVVAPQGSATAYSFLIKDSKARAAHWNRCTTVRYRVNPSGLPAGAMTEITTAIAKLAVGSGLKFAYAGTTTVVPYSTDTWVSRIPATQPAEIYIAFSTSTTVPRLAGSVAGIGGPYATVSSTGVREPKIVKGGVTIDRVSPAKPGFADGTSRGTMILHELGHAANLGHSSDITQTMYPYIQAKSRGAYQRGDLAGLAKLRAYSCF